MRCRVMIFLFLTAFGSFSLATSDLEEKKVGELKGDIAKIEKSIEITREKIRSVKDVAFIPDLYFVLAELYIDKARHLFLITRNLNPNVKEEELDFADAIKVKKQAIETYLRFIENFPKHPNLDKALFFLAHEYREVGNNEEMIKNYMRLTKEFSQSSYWEESELILGDFFLEQKKDPDFARSFYQKILDRPANPFTPMARYKLGWCYINLNKFYEALRAYEGVLTVDTKIPLDSLPELYRKSNVRRDALVALVWPYSEQTQLDSERSNALNYFERLTPDRLSLMKALERLGKRLMVKNRAEQAVPVFIRLLEISHELNLRIEVIDELFEAIKKSKKEYDYSVAAAEVIKTLFRIRGNETLPSELRQKAETNYELVLRDMGTRMLQRSKVSRNPEFLQKTILTLEEYLKAYPRSNSSSVMMVNLAEAYFAAQSYSRSGYWYELASRRFGSGARKDVVDSTLQTYALALKNAEKFSKLEVVEAREGFRDVGIQFIKTYPEDQANPMIYFNIGRTFYDERDFAKAVTYLRNFINTYPFHKEVPTAGQLILDSYNQREDYAGLIRAGQELVNNARIENPTFKKDVKELIRQAAYRKTQNEGGDPRSRAYAKNLLSFAEKYQGTTVGDQALYEAFSSYRKKKDAALYQPGEILLSKHANSKYAKEVMSQMGRIALDTADYRRAAVYFEQYARKFPKDPESTRLLRNAAGMREIMGDHREAAEDFRELGNENNNLVKQYVLAQDWQQVAQTLGARPSNQLKADYWLGLALFRMGQVDPARPYLVRATQKSPKGAEEKVMAAHALYLLAVGDLKVYQGVQLSNGNEQSIVKQKAQMLEDLVKKFNRVIQYGNGRWTIASLYELGRAHKEFANFISQAAVPSGLNAVQADQYRQLVAQQAGQYAQKAKGFFRSCTENAEKYEVFTNFVKGCQSNGNVNVDESVEERSLSKAAENSPAAAEKVRRKLWDNPKNAEAIFELGIIAVQAGDYSMGRLLFSRSLELNSKLTKAESWIGVTWIYMNDLEAAASAFKSVFAKTQKDPVALYGMAALYKQFGFQAMLSGLSPRLKSVKRPTGPIHPWMASLR